jgi:RNA polymerase sigma factor (sigma-70 family)
LLSFHDLYERHARDVFRFSLFLTGKSATAEDLTSETFVRAWTARGAIREATVRAYLLTIAKNLWRDAQRRESRLVPLDAVAGAPDHPRADALADLRWTERQLDQIAAGDRAALLLHAREGLSYDEVAERLGVSIGAVKSRIFRARQALSALRDPVRRREGDGS